MAAEIPTSRPAREFGTGPITFAAALTMLAGAATLVSWSRGRLRPILPFGSPTPMNPLTAVALLLAGAGLALLAGVRPGRPGPPAARVLGLAVMSIAALKLARNAGLSPWDVDAALFRTRLAAAADAPNRIATSTAAALLFSGLALTFAAGARRAAHAGAQIGALVTTALALTAVVGYAQGSEALGRLGGTTPMSPDTAFAFFALAAGLLACRPELGIVGLARSEGMGGALVRRLLPAALGVPLVLGAMRYRLVRSGWLQPSTGVAITTATEMVTLFAITWIVAVWTDRLDHARRQSERAAAEQSEFLDSVIESLPTMVFVKEARELRFVRFNRAGEVMLGRPRSDLLGRTLYDILSSEEAAWREEADRRMIETLTEAVTSEEPILTKHLGERTMRFRRVPIFDRDGRPAYLLGIGEDVTELRRSEARVAELHRELEHRAEQLQASNRELEAFSYSVSHDLRAPLRHIDGFCDLLQRRASDRLDDQGRKYLGVIAQSAKSMGQLIDDLLAFSRMARADLNRGEVDLDKLVRDVGQELAAQAPGRTIDWRIGALPAVSGDAAMLRLAFVNLLGNAVKYTSTRERAVIEVDASLSNGEVVVCVRDNGVGFDMAYVHKLFGVFQRLHRNEDFEGTGIGLANVRRIVHRHGGRTWAEGVVDGGASFYVALPGTVAVDAGDSLRGAA